MLVVDKGKLRMNRATIYDKRAGQWMSPNTGAPFSMLRGMGCNDCSSGLGFVDPATATMLAQAAPQILDKIAAFFSLGTGRREANMITPMQNDIHYNVLAPISAALDNPETLTLQDLEMMLNTLETTEQAWLSFLQTTQWSDGRAAIQAEATLKPYFTEFKNEIRTYIGQMTGTVYTGTVPSIPGGTGYPPRYTTTGSGGSGTNFLNSVSSYMPMILAGAAIVMLPRLLGGRKP